MKTDKFINVYVKFPQDSDYQKIITNIDSFLELFKKAKPAFFEMHNVSKLFVDDKKNSCNAYYEDTCKTENTEAAF